MMKPVRRVKFRNFRKFRYSVKHKIIGKLISGPYLDCDFNRIDRIEGDLLWAWFHVFKLACKSGLKSSYYHWAVSGDNPIYHRLFNQE